MPYAGELRRILAHTGGLIPSLQAILNPEPRVLEAYIYGSWAARYYGQPGPFPNDIDIALVTEFTGYDLLLPWLDASRDLHIEINTHHYHPDHFDPDDDPILSTSRMVRIK